MCSSFIGVYLNYKACSECFMFSLSGPHTGAFKALVQSSSSYYATYQNDDFGPSFGTSDLRLGSSGEMIYGCATTFGGSYEPPPGFTIGSSNTQTLLVGNNDFTPGEIEVFFLK